MKREKSRLPSRHGIELIKTFHTPFFRVNARGLKEGMNQSNDKGPSREEKDTDKHEELSAFYFLLVTAQRGDLRSGKR